MPAWAFNLRTNRNQHPNSDSDSDSDSVTVPTTHLSDDAQLLNDLDLSTRPEEVRYNANPWSIAKINAASRPTQKNTGKSVPSISVPGVKRKAPQRGSIVDGFKKQVQRQQKTSLNPKTANSKTVLLSHGRGSDVNAVSCHRQLINSKSKAERDASASAPLLEFPIKSQTPCEQTEGIKAPSLHILEPTKATNSVSPLPETPHIHDSELTRVQRYSPLVDPKSPSSTVLGANSRPQMTSFFTESTHIPDPSQEDSSSKLKCPLIDFPDDFCYASAVTDCQLDDYAPDIPNLDVAPRFVSMSGTQLHANDDLALGADYSRGGILTHTIPTSVGRTNDFLQTSQSINPSMKYQPRHNPSFPPRIHNMAPFSSPLSHQNCSPPINTRTQPTSHSSPIKPISPSSHGHVFTRLEPVGPKSNIPRPILAPTSRVPYKVVPTSSDASHSRFGHRLSGFQRQDPDYKLFSAHKPHLEPQLHLNEQGGQCLYSERKPYCHQELNTGLAPDRNQYQDSSRLLSPNNLWMPQWLASALPPFPKQEPHVESHMQGLYTISNDTKPASPSVPFLAPVPSPQMHAKNEPPSPSQPDISRDRFEYPLAVSTPRHPPAVCKQAVPSPSPISSRNHGSAPFISWHQDSTPPRRIKLHYTMNGRKRDPYAFVGTSDPDEEWSTLPVRSKKRIGGKGTKTHTKTKISGTFRLPIGLTAGLRNGRNSGDVAYGKNQLQEPKRRVITFLPPPLESKRSMVLMKNDTSDLMNISASDLHLPCKRPYDDYRIEQTPRKKVKHEEEMQDVSRSQYQYPSPAGSRVSPPDPIVAICLPVSPDEPRKDEKAEGRLPSPPTSDLPAIEGSVDIRTAIDCSMIRFEDQIEHSGDGVKVGFDVSGVRVRYPQTMISVNKRKRASACIWDLLELPSCGIVYRDQDGGQETRKLEEVEELPIVVWSGVGLMCDSCSGVSPNTNNTS